MEGGGVGSGGVVVVVWGAGLTCGIWGEVVGAHDGRVVRVVAVQMGVQVLERLSLEVVLPEPEGHRAELEAQRLLRAAARPGDWSWGLATEDCHWAYSLCQTKNSIYPVPCAQATAGYRGQCFCLPHLHYSYSYLRLYPCLHC